MQLCSDTDNDSEELAATPKAVKTVMDETKTKRTPPPGLHRHPDPPQPHRMMPPVWKQRTQRLCANCLLRWLAHRRKFWTP